ncbi:MAG: N-acetyltransferase [Pseudomonadota bacterium]
MNIRPATKEDATTIGQIAEATDLFPASLLDDMIAGYLNQTSKDIWLVGEVDSKVVAFIFCEPERMTDGTWNMLAIGVLPDLQGRGHGASMTAHLERDLKKSGQRILIVETMGTPELAMTRAFYRKNGYAEEGRIREFYEPGADKVIYWKAL